MTQSIRNSFLSRYPGPYSVQPGRDGVDCTFDISCRTTSKHIVSAAYWHEEESALLIASALTIAMESARLRKPAAQFADSLKLKIQQFAKLYPGPYSCKEFAQGDRAEIGVTDAGGDSLLVSFVTMPGDMQAIDDSTYIATALNRLFWPALVSSD